MSTVACAPRTRPIARPWPLDPAPAGDVAASARARPAAPANASRVERMASYLREAPRTISPGLPEDQRDQPMTDFRRDAGPGFLRRGAGPLRPGAGPRDARGAGYGHEAVLWLFDGVRGGAQHAGVSGLSGAARQPSGHERPGDRV